MSASAYQLHQLPHYGRHALALDATDWVCADLLAHHFAGRSTRSRLCSDLGMRYVAAEAERLQAKIPERLAAGAMMLSMLEAARTANDDQFEALCGQALGVMNQLAPFLVDAAYHAGHELDGLDTQKVLPLANAGPAFEEHAYIASLTTEE